MDNEKIVMKWGENRMATLIIKPFDGDVNIEDLLKIDYSNLMGEILTFPVVFNRVANMKAEMANILAERKLNMDIFEAQLTEEHGNKLRAQGKATIKDIEVAVLRDVRYQIKKKDLFQCQKDFDYLDSLYWSAKSKDGKLDRLSEKLRPDDFNGELLAETINGVQIKISKNVIR